MKCNGIDCHEPATWENRWSVGFSVIPHLNHVCDNCKKLDQDAIERLGMRLEHNEWYPIKEPLRIN